MKTILGISIAASLAVFAPQSADACQSNAPFSQQDIAFADVIFEGRLTDISSKDRFVELTFDVHDVVRGELPEGQVVIGWKDWYYTGDIDLSFEEKAYIFGETTRVAISTPEVAKRFCEWEMVQGNIRDDETGEIVTKESPQSVCESTAVSLVSVSRENLPFVLSNGRRCGSTYFYPVARYEKMRNYEENLQAFRKLIADGIRPSREVYLEMLGPVESLPWKARNTSTDNLAAQLLREHGGFFKSSLRTNAAWQASLLDSGVTMARESLDGYESGFDDDEASRLKFRESLRKEILKLLDYIEKDPNYRDRLLLED